MERRRPSKRALRDRQTVTRKTIHRFHGLLRNGRLSSIEEAQILNYLKVTGLHTGLILNFGTRSLEQKRFILT
jgi:hypothetical protein